MPRPNRARPRSPRSWPSWSGAAPGRTPATRLDAIATRPWPSSRRPACSSPRPASTSRGSSSRSSTPRPTARAAKDRSHLAVGLVVLGLLLLAVADHQDLADPPPVGRLDGQGQAVDEHLVARLRHAADPVVDQPADRVVLVLVLEAQLDVE